MEVSVRFNARAREQLVTLLNQREGDTLTPRSGKLNKICEREVEMYLER